MHDRLVALEKANDELREMVDDLRGQTHAAPTLKRDTRCPACSGRRVIHAPQILDRDQGGRNELALAQPSVWKSAGLGEFEAFVCASCGFCELWVKNVADVVASMKAGNLKSFRLIDAETNADMPGPYR